jgi:hypothetical protein
MYLNSLRIVFMKIPFQNLSIILLILILVLGACDYSTRNESQDHMESMPELAGDDNTPGSFTPPRQSYRLWHTSGQFDLRAFKYYGGFFNDRLKFYYATRPGLKMAGTDIDLIMLYFLDDRLVKIRYHLAGDVTDPILDSLGLGLLETRYNLRKMVMATDQSIRRLKEYNLEKGKRDEYNIVWDRQIIESSYHVDPNPSSLYTFDTIKANFVYVDQLKSYQKNLIKLENELRQKLMLSAEK